MIEKENEIRFQSFEFEDELYYIPQIKNVKVILDIISKNVKSEDDLSIAICREFNDEVERAEVINPTNCIGIGTNCNQCFLRMDDLKKYKAFQEFCDKKGYKLSDLEKSKINVDNETIIKIMDCFNTMSRCCNFKQYDKHNLSDVKEFKKYLPYLLENLEKILNKKIY